MSTSRARELRAKLTDAERRLWDQLRGRQLGHYKFRRQQPVGPYIVDFVCFEKKLILELDGGQHNRSEQAAYDSVRTAWLESQGFKVLRFWNNQIFNELESVKSYLREALETRHD
ncbi:MAG: endonuclease domain-containing protein [Dehalococcoidia bacterium]